MADAIAYVPKVTNDVFISYCHADNTSELPNERGWITDFGERLKVRLGLLLGSAVEVWWDKKLYGDHALDLEIRSRVEQTAVFLAIVTPSYLKSEYCRDEREWFRTSAGGKMMVGNRMRGIRVVKTPKWDGSRPLHRTVFPEGLGFEFFPPAKDETDEVEEFLRTSREFQDEFGKVCRRVGGLLETMRRQCVTVYVAHCSQALKDERGRVVAELTAHGYRVLPDIEIDPTNVESVTANGLEDARLSVHLFGACEHLLSERQATIAMDKGRPMVIWTSSAELHRRETPYGRFLLDLMKHSDYLDRKPLEDVKTEVMKLLEPGPQTARTAAAGGPRRVYILCNRTEPEDIRQAWQIRKWIMERDHFEVVLPEMAPLDPAELIEDHRAKLQGCEGLLLYWGHASKDWFETSRNDLAARRFKSGAIALGDASLSVAGAGAAPVIPLYQDFRYEALEPFLQPLRA